LLDHVESIVELRRRLLAVTQIPPLGRPGSR
jgi:hypothetical protein